MMAKVKTFRLNPKFGVPDKDIRDWLSEAEEDLGIISVETQYIPPMGESDGRLTVIATKLDDLPPPVK